MEALHQRKISAVKAPAHLMSSWAPLCQTKDQAENRFFFFFKFFWKVVCKSKAERA